MDTFDFSQFKNIQIQTPNEGSYYIGFSLVNGGDYLIQIDRRNSLPKYVFHSQFGKRCTICDEADLVTCPVLEDKMFSLADCLLKHPSIRLRQIFNRLL